MKMRRDELFLADIEESCENIHTYLFDVTVEAFKENRMLQDAVVRNIEIIGEAAKNLSEEIKSQSSQVAWKEIMRMRDKIVHHYFRLNLDVIWLTATEDIPQLRQEIERLAQDEG